MRWRNGALWLAMVAGSFGCKPARSTPRVVVACAADDATPPEPLVLDPPAARPVENLAVAWHTRDRYVSSVAAGSFVLTDGRALFAVDARDGRQTAPLRAIEPAPELDLVFAQVPGRIAVLEARAAPCPDQPNCTGSTHRLLGLSPTREDAAWSIDLGFAPALRSLRAVASDRVSLFLVQEGDRARAFDVDGHERWSLSGLTQFGSLSWELAPDRLLVTDHTHTIALHPDLGCSFWTVDEAMLGAHGRQVVTARSAGAAREILVRAAANGTIEHRFATNLYPVRAAIAGSVLVVQSHDESLAAYDLRTEQALWKRSGVDVWATTDDAVFVSNRSCVLRALTPATGAVSYEYSLACDGGQGIVPRLWVVASGVGNGIAVDRDAELIVLARASTKAPPVSKIIRGVVHLNGAVAAGVRVHVGEQVVTTGDDGRYSARVTTPGSVMVVPSTEDLARFSPKENEKHRECQLVVTGAGYPAPPVAIDALGAEQTVSFDLHSDVVCIGI